MRLLSGIAGRPKILTALHDYDRSSPCCANSSATAPARPRPFINVRVAPYFLLGFFGLLPIGLPFSSTSVCTVVTGPYPMSCTTTS